MAVGLTCLLIAIIIPASLSQIRLLHAQRRVKGTSRSSSNTQMDQRRNLRITARLLTLELLTLVASALIFGSLCAWIAIDGASPS